MQIAVEPVEVADPVQDAGLDQRLVEEPVGIAALRMAAGIEPNFLALPLELLLADRMVGFSSCAMAYEQSERADPGRNLAIRRRIFLRALTTILGRGYLRRASAKPWVFFHLVSDKILRYFIGLISTAVLVLAVLVGGATLAVTLGGLLAACLLAMIPDTSGSGPAGKLSRASTFFIIVNLASLLAVGDYLSGRSYSRW